MKARIVPQPTPQQKDPEKKIVLSPNARAALMMLGLGFPLNNLIETPYVKDGKAFMFEEKDHDK